MSDFGPFAILFPECPPHSQPEARREWNRRYVAWCHRLAEMCRRVNAGKDGAP